MGSSGTANNRLFLVLLPILSDCATTTSDGGQVREIPPGIYKVGVARAGSSVVFGGTEAINTAIDQAGQFCHVKEQKLVIVPTRDKDVTFRCGEKVTE